MAMPSDTVRRLREDMGLAALEARVASLIPTERLEARLAALEGRRPTALPETALTLDVERRLAALEEWQDSVEEAVVAVRKAQDEIRKRLDALEAFSGAANRERGAGGQAVPVREQALPPVGEMPAPPALKPKEKKR